VIKGIAGPAPLSLKHDQTFRKDRPRARNCQAKVLSTTRICINKFSLFRYTPGSFEGASFSNLSEPTLSWFGFHRDRGGGLEKLSDFARSGKLTSKKCAVIRNCCQAQILLSTRLGA